ncbi:MAG: ABC transporter ATP-binding protein [Nitrospinae bacterium]|nr:ABC transporter ATP-binding protein [Nitrospinota bacterium]
MIAVENIRRVYTPGGTPVVALNDVSLNIGTGEFVAVMGPSGSGKSTFMHIIGCLDRPTSGAYRLDGEDVSGFSKDKLAEVRGKKIGFVFQGFNLIPRTTAVENVELPMLYNGFEAKERRRRALEALITVGLEEKADRRPNELSGGQQQRVAIARAIVNDALIMLADEPTGNLDTKTSQEIMELFVRLNREAGKTIIVVTHEPDIASYAKRTVRFRDGNITKDERKW